MNDRLPSPTFEVNFEDDPLQPHPGYLEQLSPGPIGFWRMDALTGTTEEDQTSNNRDLTYTNAPTLGAAGAFSSYGDLSTSVQFNGTDEYAATGNSTTWQNLNSAWTLGAWIYPTGTPTDNQTPTIIGVDRNASAGRTPAFMNMGANSGGPGVSGNKVWAGYWNTGAWGGDATVAIDPNAVTLNTWHFYVATWDGVTLNLYRNGVWVDDKVTTLGNGAAGGSVPLMIGRAVTDNTPRYFPGRIDEPFVFDYALDATQIALLYKYLTIRTPDEANFVDLTADADTTSDGQTLSRLRAFAPRRGRSDPTSRVGAGTATVTLSNHDGLLLPAPIVNLLPNPSAEHSEAGLPFKGENATVAYDTTHVRTGNRAWKLTTGTSIPGYATNAISGLMGMRPGKTYTFSAYLHVPTGVTLSNVRVEIVDEVAGAQEIQSTSSPAALDAFHRLEVTKTIRAAADAAYVRVRLNEASDSIWIEDVQLEEAGAASSFVYGESTDCTWLGEAHQSPTICRTGGMVKAGFPMRSCRLIGTWDGTDYDILHGYVERIQHTFARGVDPVVVYSVVDGTRVLAAMSMRGFSRSSERTGDRVRAILAFAGIPTDKIDVDDDYIDTLALSAQATIDADTSALALINDIEQTERGTFFVSRDGMFTYRGSRYRSTGAVEAAVFSDEDNSLEVRYSDVAMTIDIGTVANDVNIENVASGNNHSFDYPLSQARYFPVSASEQSRWASDTADDVDRSIAMPNAEQVVVYGAKNPDEWWPRLLGLELGDLCRIERHVGSTDLWQGYVHFLEGYSLDASPGNWTMSLLTSPELAHPIEADPWQTSIARPILKTSRYATGGGTTVTLPSATYTAGRLYVVYLSLFASGGTSPSDPTVTSGNTWTNINASNTGTLGATAYRYKQFYSVASSTVTETLQFNFSVTGPSAYYDIVVVEIASGFDATPIGDTPGTQTGNQVSGQNDVGTLTDAESVVLCGIFKDAAATPSTNGVSLYARAGPPTDSYHVVYGQPGVDTITVDWGGIANGWGSIAIEIEAA